jgi:hypothetical protein
MSYNNFGTLSTIPLQHLVDVAETYGDIEPILNEGGHTQTVALSCANTVMNAICSTAFPHKWNEFNIPPIYSNSFQQDYAVVNPAGLTGTLTLTQVTQVSTAAGTTTYAGTMPDGAFGGYVGVPFVIAGFTNGGNNGTFMCVASSAVSFVLQNTGGVLETHAATAISAAGPLLNMSWLERGVAFDINNSAIPKPFARIECGRQLPQITATYTGGAGLGDPGFRCNWFPNRTLYYGTWGQANVGGATLGNNPGPGSVYYQPTGSAVTAASWSSGSGGQATFTITSLLPTIKVGSTLQITSVFPVAYNGSWTIVSINDSVLTAPTVTVTMTVNPGTYESGGDVDNSANTDQPDNPITQIIDANGNFLLLTTYGIEGTAPPLAARNAVPGTTVSGAGASTQWTVLDPNGWGFRFTPVPSSTGTEWQFNLTAQMKPVRFVSLSQTLAPLPDEFETFFRDGFIAQLYHRSPEKAVYAKFPTEWKLWQQALMELRVKEDRELEENKFIPSRTVFGAARSRNNFQGAAWPYNYPRP